MIVVLKINFIEEVKRMYQSKRVVYAFTKCMDLIRRDMLTGSGEFITYIASSINGFSWEVSPDGSVVNLTTKVLVTQDGIKITERTDLPVINNALQNKIRKVCASNKLDSEDVIKALSSLIEVCESRIYSACNVEEGVNVINIGSVDYKDGRLIVLFGDSNEEKHPVHE